MTRSTIKKFIKIVLTFAILLFIINNFDVNLNELTSGITNISYVLLDFIIPLFVLPIISANRWKLFLEQVSIKEDTLALIKISWISMFQGLILPSSQGQDLLRIYYIEKRHPKQRGSSGGTVVIERILGFLVLCLLSLAFSIYNYNRFEQQNFILIIFLITVFLLLVITLLLNKKFQAYIEKKNFTNTFLQKGVSYLGKVHKAIAYFPYHKIIFSSVFLIVLFQVATICSVYLIFKAYGMEIPLYLHISIYPVISILSMIPITISGIGIREGFFVYFYAQLDVPPDLAVFVSLLNYAVLVLTPALFGSLLYLKMVLSKNNKI